MAQTNAERQKAFRQRRNELARRAVAHSIADVELEGDTAFAELIVAHWRAGALGLLAHGDGASCPLRAGIMAEVPEQRFSLIDMLTVVEEAGAAWAVKRFEQAALAIGVEHQAAPEPVPLAIPTPQRRRKRVT